MSLTRNHKKCHVYINVSQYDGQSVIKIGISYFPEKRMREFNNGCKWRHKLGHAAHKVVFTPYFRSLPMRSQKCASIERAFKGLNANFLVTELGNEVFTLEPASAIHQLCNQIGESYGR